MFTLDLDPYEVLGISRSASGVEIRRARRELIKKYPNELFPQRAQEINEAFQLLMDKQKRRMVDSFLHSKAGYALRVQTAFLSDEVKKTLLEIPDRSSIYQLFDLGQLQSVDRISLINSLLTLLQQVSPDGAK